MAPNNGFVFDQQTRLPGLDGACGIVTGASGGMGFVLAQLLTECGARVGINGRSHARVELAVAELNSRRPDSALALPADVSQLDQVCRMSRDFLRWSAGRYDFLVCNAGYALDDTLWNTPLHAYSDEQITQGFAAVRAVDLDGARFCSREALRTMVAQKAGALVFVSSTPALSGHKGTPYTEAKAALLGLMRDIAVEYAGMNIRANAVALGDIASGWYHNLAPERIAELAAEIPLQRWGQQAEVAGTIAFLLSDLAGYITGQTLIVDGGKIIR
ncbi:MAG TPA: SDR family oxidoreductase [Bacteroidetes bacterium]|nr:SDR family oxidoreductase [Bacteroidota bacterium]